MCTLVIYKRKGGSLVKGFPSFGFWFPDFGFLFSPFICSLLFSLPLVYQGLGGVPYFWCFLLSLFLNLGVPFCLCQVRFGVQGLVRLKPICFEGFSSALSSVQDPTRRDKLDISPIGGLAVDNCCNLDCKIRHKAEILLCCSLNKYIQRVVYICLCRC